MVAVGVLTLAGSLAVAATAAGQAGPRFGENVRIGSPEPTRGRDVPGLAVNPANPNHIVEAENNPVTLQCDYNVSFDGGRTWSGGHLTIRNSGEIPPFPTPACEQNFDSGGYMHFNTGIVFGSGQNVYITFSAHRGPFNRPESNVDGGHGDDAVVARSTDGGRTFAPAVLAVPGGGPVEANPGLAGVGMRPQLAVERGAAGGQDRLYVASWHCHIKVRASQTARGGCSGGGGERRILVARSDDAGATWSAPVLASASAVRSGAAIAEAGSPDEQAREPSQPVIGPDGAIYVAYRNRDITDGTTCPVNPAITAPAPGNLPASRAHCIVIARSTDGGRTWVQRSTNQPVSTATLSNPRLAIDPTTPAGVGTLYVVYQRPVTGDPVDITLQSSTNRGESWSAPVRVNDDPAGAVQTNPWVSVGPGGRVEAVWADRRHGYPGGGPLADVYYARSTNGGTSFEANRRVTDRSINTDVGWYNELGSQFTPGFSWYGPVTLPLPEGTLLAAWPDSREGNIDNATQEVYMSRLDPSAAIATSRIETATAPGLSVVLSRLAYPGGTEALGDRGGEPVTRVVVAGEQDAGGALLGAVLARSRWGPLMLSPAGGLPGHVKAEAARLRPSGAFVIGDGSVLSDGVTRDLQDTTRGRDNVVRLAAPLNITAANRPAELARRVAEVMLPLLPVASPEAVVVNPATPEAAAGAALAAALRLPVLFVDERTTAPPPTTSAISSFGIRRALIVGGTQSVNAGVATQLSTMLGAANVRRLEGADAYATSEAVVAEGRTRGLATNVVYVADGARPVDAAVVGAAVGRLNGLLLLRPSADTASAVARLNTLGINNTVDRVVGAVGAGGTDPPAPPSPGPGDGSGPGPGTQPAPPPPPPPAPIATRGRGRLSVRVTPASDVRPPYRFTTTGRLTLPRGVGASAGCRGRVSVQVQRGGTTISTRRVFLRRNCTFSTSVTFRTRVRFASSRRLRFTVRFLGNARVSPVTAAPRFVGVAPAGRSG